MNHDECSNLEAFLAGDLSAEGAARFAAHLGACQSCSDAVDEQHWIDSLLTSPLAKELEALPSACIDSFRSATELPRGRSRRIAFILATAATLAVAAGWTALRGPLGVETDAIHGVATAGNGDADIAESALDGVTRSEDPPRATFVGGPDVVVMPVASRHANVTIVRIYPTFQPAIDTQANVDRFEADQLNGG